MAVLTDQEPLSASLSSLKGSSTESQEPVTPSSTRSLFLILPRMLQMIAAISLFLVFTLVVITPIQHQTSQNHLYTQLRRALWDYSLPQGPFAIEPDKTRSNRGRQETKETKYIPTPIGSAVGLLEIPSIKVKEVIVEGTSSRQTATGIGHQRDTVLPGQPGLSVLVGRSSAFGAPFGKLKRLPVGDKFSIITGQGRHEYQICAHRKTGDPIPIAKSGEGKLTMITAAGGQFTPEELIYLDANLITAARNPLGEVSLGSIPDEENPMQGTTLSTLVPLLILLQLIFFAVLAAVWLWQRWRHLLVWIVTCPVLLCLAVLTATQLIYLLPNVL